MIWRRRKGQCLPDHSEEAGGASHIAAEWIASARGRGHLHIPGLMDPQTGVSLRRGSDLDDGGVRGSTRWSQRLSTQRGCVETPSGTGCGVGTDALAASLSPSFGAVAILAAWSAEVGRLRNVAGPLIWRRIRHHGEAQPEHRRSLQGRHGD
jgi:hypothetical protein